MRARGFALGAGFALLAWPHKAMAGMPAIVLSDWAVLRLETLSFCLAVFALAAAVVRWLWNGLAKEFPWLPRLSYGRALAALMLWSGAMAVVLTMIAGSRELLTPAAWQREGLLYKVVPKDGLNSEADSSGLRERRERLEQLQLALWQYAAAHSGRFPRPDDPSIDPALWDTPGPVGMRYGYRPGKTVSDEPSVLVYEPQLFGSERLVLYANSELAMLSSAELRRKLEEDKERCEP